MKLHSCQPDGTMMLHINGRLDTKTGPLVKTLKVAYLFLDWKSLFLSI